MAEMEARHQADDLTAERAAALFRKLDEGLYYMREGGKSQQEQDKFGVDLLLQFAQQTRQDALREAARQVCLYCSGNARGYMLGVAGPNSAGNYTHEVPEDSWAKEGVLCRATSIWSLIYYENRLASEGG